MTPSILSTRPSSIRRWLMSLTLALTSIPTSALAGQPDATTSAPATEPAPLPAAEPAPLPAAEPQPVAQPQPLPPAPVAPAPQPRANRGLGLMIAGLGVFSFSYLITAVTGAVIIDAGNPDIGRPLLIPLVGPFMDIGRTGSATAGIGLAFAGIAQLAGFGMAVGGGVMFGISRHKARTTALVASPARSARIARPRLVLTAAPGGLALRF